MSVKKQKIFISHISDESKVAIVIKSLLVESFGDRVDVFVSSDYESIQSGEAWYQKIVDSIKSSDTLIVLLSRQSINHPWLFFEPGVSIGAAKTIIPIVIRNLKKNDVPLPLSALHLRNIHDSQDVEAITNELASKLNLSLSRVDYQNFVQNIQKEEKDLPYKGLYIKPFAEKQTNSFIIRFQIINSGTIDMDLLAVEVGAPEALLLQNWGRPSKVSGLFDIKNEIIGGIQYMQWRHCVYDGPIAPGYGFPERLPTCISPSLSPLTLSALRFPLKKDLTEEECNQKIQCKAFAKNFNTETHLIPIKDILETTESNK